MESLELVGNNWIWDGGCYSHLFGFGGVMITIAILVMSTGYFGVIGVPSVPYFWPDLGNIYKRKGRKRPVRVYMDGCFDLMHYGHANALRQAKSLGDELVVGVVSDKEIIVNKGPPVLSMDERLILVSGLKWVDEVIANAPYEINEQFMNSLFNEYNIDYVIHGDDPCLLPDGTDAYALAKKAGRYKQIKRTEGVSSTDIVGRILTTMSGAEIDKSLNNSSNRKQFHCEDKSEAETLRSVKAQSYHFLPTSRRIVQFSNGKELAATPRARLEHLAAGDRHEVQGPRPNAHVVYIDGAFDLFHAGHVEILRCARQLGDFLLVGVHNDQTVSTRRGSPPIMHLHERCLSVLGCRYVDEVIIGAPWEVTKDMMTTFNISLVVHGTINENSSNAEDDPYITPKSMGIFQMITSPRNTTSTSVARRILDSLEAYKKRNLTKKAKEEMYYADKKFVAGD